MSASLRHAVRCAAVLLACISPLRAGAQSRAVADTEIVRGAGVPTDADDTAATRYGKHETPRGVPTPACRPRGVALCLADTARRVYAVNCCAPDERQTDWLVFAAARDSIQFFLRPSMGGYLRMSPASASGASAETSRAVDASWLRARFPALGSYVFTAAFESEMVIPYELRVAPVITTGASQPIGAAASLTLRAKRRTLIAVAPHSMISRDAAEMKSFAVKPGTYRVLLVRDTLYTACALPCVHLTIFTLKAGEAVAVAP